MTVFVGGTGDDIFVGTGENDVAVGNGGNDTLDGGDGNDELVGGEGDDTLIGGAGSDALYAAGRATDYWNWFDGLDRESDRDVLNGGDGDDWISAGYGDMIDGGSDAGVDRLSISFMGAAAGVTADFRAPSLNIGGGTIIGIEIVEFAEGSRFDDFIALGNGGSGYDTSIIFGMGGNDTLIGGATTDSIYGGDGNDIVDMRAFASTIFSFRGVEAYGEGGDDTFYADFDPDHGGYFDGGDGNDTFFVSGTVYGGAGADTFHVQHGAANDWLMGGIGNDTFFAVAGSTGQMFGDEGNDTFNGGPDAESMFGGADNDLLIGGGGVNILFGDGGDDRIVVTGADSGTVVAGGFGFDTLSISGNFVLGVESYRVPATFAVERVELSGGSLTLVGSEFFVFLTFDVQISGTGGIVVDMAESGEISAAGWTVDTGSIITFTVTGSAGNDAIKGLRGAANTLKGGSGDDLLRGGLLDDMLEGGSGDDKLIGGFGGDSLTGGTGADHFRFLAANHSGIGSAADRITDFEIGIDKIALRQLDSDPFLPGIQGFAFIGRQTFGASGAAELRYAKAGADLVVQLDLDGDGAADMEIFLLGLAGQALSGSDFLL